ncbi:Peptidyl-prolyl cis-trans isomerase FKBP2 [Pseudolycoriella hygida]|uniref:peptidylprolyl isomerase n=1 Tax=Pseudolycoriella hygida TaxID=35572 RepID=A0A9Q0MJY8_9DIPT|nr:Peptidyl-prolyl cis-trans isomerase FKBP2 [Pseudolycoriella hygida]
MKCYLTIFFVCIVALCVDSGTITKKEPELKIETLKAVECRKKSKIGDYLMVHYRGYLADGKEFDDSYKRGHAVMFHIGQKTVIKAWDEGLLDMCEGEKRRIISPPEFAYGDTGFSGMVPPGATLTFECELLHINLRDEL